MEKVSIEGGYRCNNNCIFCYNKARRNSLSLTEGEIEKRLVEIKDKNYINFSGGEFTIRKDAIEIIKFAKKIGFKNICLTTNGRVLSYPKIAGKFIDAGINHITYSIHGHNAKLHDFLTQTKESFEQITKAIKNTQKLGIPFSANVTINRFNYKSLPKIAQFLVDLGCRDAEFIYIYPSNKSDEFLAPIKETAAYIRRTLDIGIKNNAKNWSVKDYPLCYLESYENHISKGSLNDKVKSLNCVNCKYIGMCEGIWKVYAEKRGTDELIPVKDLPEEVKVELTHKCNLKCDFCFNKNYPNKKELSLEELKKVVDNIHKSKIKAVRFTGGEPFLRKDLEKILEYAKSRGLYVILNTNGLLIREDALKHVDDLLISFHDIKEVKEKEELFKKLRKYNLLLRCCTIMNKKNISKLEEFYKFMDKQLVEDWFLLRPVPNPSDLEPITKKDIGKLVEKVLALNKKYKTKTRIANAIPYCSYIPRKLQSVCVGGRNDDGHTRIVIDTEGNIKPSYFNDNIIGNVIDDSIISCWNSDYMKSIRNLELVPEECKACEFIQACKGGLRFAAKLVKKKEGVLDPLAKGIEFAKDFQILLINPAYHNFHLPIEPLALEYIASTLEKHNYEVRILDLNIDDSEIKKVIEEYKPDVVGISNMTLQVNNGYRIGNFIKKNFPHINLVYGGIHQPFVYGGMHSMAFPKEPFEKGSADFVIIHEGEKVFLELVNALEKDKDIGKENIKDLCYKSNGKIIMNTERNVFENLDDLPLPARHLINIKKYKNDIHILPYAKNLAADLITSRGCPNNCDYCTSPLFYNRDIRVRSAENILEEIKEIVNDYKIKYIHFHDDCFLLNPKIVEELCNNIIKEKLNIRWICLASINSLMKTKNLFKLMNKAGCVGIEIGLENADSEVLRIMNKKQKVEDIIIIDNLLKESNIAPMYLIISFYIGETIDTAKKTKDLLEKLSSKNLQIIDYLKSVHLPYSFGQFATPYPGTRFYNTKGKQGICFSKSWDDYNRQKVNFIPYSFLQDIPVKTKIINREEFNKEINKFKDSIKYYLKDSELMGFNNYDKYLDFLHKIYDESKGIKTVEKLLPQEDIRHVGLCIKFLSMVEMVGSKK